MKEPWTAVTATTYTRGLGRDRQSLARYPGGWWFGRGNKWEPTGTRDIAQAQAWAESRSGA